MNRTILVVALLAACRSSDGKPRGAPAAGASASGSVATAAPMSDSARQNALLERADRARIQGDSAAKVWIVEISDFECPFCRQWHEETYPAVLRDYIRTGVVRMAYVNFPLGQHPHAMPAAEAAMCSAAQDRFWPMHDAIFNTQQKWVSLQDAMPLYDSLATSIGVDMSQWRDCIKSQVMRRLIGADRGRALTAGVGSTPTFFVGDEPIKGAATMDAFRDAIARARAKAGSGEAAPR